MLFHEQADMMLGSRQVYDAFGVHDDHELTWAEFRKFHPMSLKVTALRQSAISMCVCPPFPVNTAYYYPDITTR